MFRTFIFCETLYERMTSLNLTQVKVENRETNTVYILLAS